MNFGEEKAQGNAPFHSISGQECLSQSITCGSTQLQVSTRCGRNMDVGSLSSIRLKVLNIYNVVFYHTENVNVYFHFPLVLLFTNSNKKISSLFMNIYPLNDYPNYLQVTLRFKFPTGNALIINIEHMHPESVS